MTKLRRAILLLAFIAGGVALSGGDAAADGPCSDVIASTGEECSICEIQGCIIWICSEEGGSACMA